MTFYDLDKIDAIGKADDGITEYVLMDPRSSEKIETDRHISIVMLTIRLVLTQMYGEQKGSPFRIVCLYLEKPPEYIEQLIH